MKRLFAVLGIVVVLLIGFIFWWKTSLAPVQANDQTNKTFVIAKGDGIREIAKKLHDEGLIRDQIAFFLLVKKLGLEKNIQAGTYQLSPSLSANDLAYKLTVGTDDVKITIPEGWRNEEIWQYLKSKGFVETVSTDTHENIPIIGTEGFLFPDTYLVPKTASLDDVLRLMRANFDQKAAPLIQAANPRGDLIVASLVEREARTEADRPLVASVIINRLKAGMALDVDASVQYAIGYTAKDGWWKKELTLDDLKFKSPYNTYINPGLPPGPICNPGLSAIKAAVNPAQTDYLFYISDKSGRMHYAKTLEEHNQNIAKYL